MSPRGVDERVGRPAYQGRLRGAVLLAVAGCVLVVLAVLVLSTGEDDPPAEVAVTEKPPAAPAPAPTPVFTDVTEEAGIAFVHGTARTGQNYLPETLGSGAAFFDADGDGDADLILLDASYWPDAAGDVGAGDGPAAHAIRFYVNDGTGRFAQATDGSGLEGAMRATGIATGDFDADGRVDVFVTAVGANRLFRNEGGGRFADVTAQAGVAGDPAALGTSAVFFDHDGDGDLDLFVANYVRWSPEIDRRVDYRIAGIGRAHGPPSNFPGSHSYLYRNDGEGRFTDVSADAGIEVDDEVSGEPVGKALAVLAMDIDGDRAQDLVVTNDTTRNFLFLNRGDGSFREVGVESGIARDATGTDTGSAGLDVTWFGKDASLALTIGNFANEMAAFYVEETRGRAGTGAAQAGGAPEPAAVQPSARDGGDDAAAVAAVPRFHDRAVDVGLGPPTRRPRTFAVLFFDYDLDGRQDLLLVNGHVEDDIASVQPDQSHAQAAQLFWNCGPVCDRPWQAVPAEALGELATPIVGRAATRADVDGDGDTDLLITTLGGAPRLLRNDTPREGRHWLRIRLRDERSRNRFGLGARVLIDTGEGIQQRVVTPARSYLSQVEPVASFGLGMLQRVPRATIVWPDGRTQELQGLRVDKVYEIARPLGDPIRLQLDRTLEVP